MNSSSGPEIRLDPGWISLPPGLGEHPPGSVLPIGPLLRAWFERLDADNLEWVVLRNAGGLPDYTRYDVDILLSPPAAPAALHALETAAGQTGWQIIATIQKAWYRCLLLAQNVPSTPFFLPLDLFTALEYRGLRYLDERQILAQRVRQPDGVWSLPPGIQAAITLLKELLPHRRLKENSRAAVRQQAAADPATFRQTLESAVGPDWAEKLLAATNAEIWEFSPNDWRQLRAAIRRRNPGWRLGWWRALAANLGHFSRPAAGRFICLAGADGSGKTTLARDLIARTYKKPFKAVRYLHGNSIVLPRLRDVRAAFLRRQASPPPEPLSPAAPLKGMMKPLPPWKSIALALYYGLDWFLARPLLRRWRSQWALIIADRSFYDFYFQLGHRRCPPAVLNGLARWIPRPDLLLCLEDEPARIHARKPELTEEEICVEQNLLAARTGHWPFARRISGQGGVEAMAQEAARALWATFETPGRRRFRIWSAGSRPLLATTADDRQSARQALNLFPRTTAKRKALHAGIRLLTTLHLERSVSRPATAPENWFSGADLDELLQRLAQTKGQPVDSWLLAWPARRERQRLYLICRFKNIEPLTVVKIGAGPANRSQFGREADCLRCLAIHSHPFSIPGVLFLRELDAERIALALDGFPRRMKPLSLIRASEWSRRIIAHLQNLSSGPWVHGDLGPGNMLVADNGGLFLFDWENATAGPLPPVDVVAFWLALRQNAVRKCPARMAQKLQQAFPHIPAADLRAALEVLRQHDNLAATLLTEVWS